MSTQSSRYSSPTSPTEGVGRRQAAEILLARSSKVGTTGDERSVDFSAVPAAAEREVGASTAEAGGTSSFSGSYNGTNDHPIVRRGQFDIDHLHGGEVSSTTLAVNPGASVFSRCFSVTSNNNRPETLWGYGFDLGFELVIDRTDRQIVLQLLERLLDLDQWQ